MYVPQRPLVSRSYGEAETTGAAYENKSHVKTRPRTAIVLQQPGIEHPTSPVAAARGAEAAAARTNPRVCAILGVSASDYPTS